MTSGTANQTKSFIYTPDKKKTTNLIVVYTLVPLILDGVTVGFEENFTVLLNVVRGKGFLVGFGLKLLAGFVLVFVTNPGSVVNCHCGGELDGRTLVIAL